MKPIICLIPLLFLTGCMSPWKQVMQCERICERGVDEVNTRGMSVVCYCVEDARYVIFQ